MQSGNIRLAPGADVVPAHDLGNFTDHAVVETYFAGGVDETYVGVAGGGQLVKYAQQIALAGNRRRQLIVTDPPAPRKLDQPHAVQSIRLEVSVLLQV
jgi:hypothetical protein